MLQLTMWYLLNVYMCEKVHVRTCMQCWREFAKCRFTHFPSFFSVHVDTYGLVRFLFNISRCSELPILSYSFLQSGGVIFLGIVTSNDSCTICK